MLKLVKESSNKKLGPCAATYRSGEGDVYSTCPSSCPLKPPSSRGSNKLDLKYFDAVSEAVPEGGVAWTYTHFSPLEVPFPTEGGTCINISTDSVSLAIESFELGYPTVIVTPSSQSAKCDKVDGIRMVRCPAEYSNVNCFTCGGKVPLCARQDRDYIIKFTAHGSGAKLIDNRSQLSIRSGGCYGNSGPVRLQWNKVVGPTKTDADDIVAFAKSLPKGTKLRHHVVGDFGV